MIELQKLLQEIITSHELHAKWLNTLSFLENCGARKIAACEHPTQVKEEMLKHAAEEFRHAYHLKRQIEKIGQISLDTYSPSSMLGGVASLHYLQALDARTCRYLQALGFSKSAIKEAAYLLVTYAIELRAGRLYPIYEEILRTASSRVSVKSILLEEQEHLNEMTEALHKMPMGMAHAQQICAIEDTLYKNWLQAIAHGALFSVRERAALTF